MAKATLFKEIDNGRIYKNSKGQAIMLSLNDDQTEITIKDLKGNQIGEFEFKELDYGNGYKLMRMYSNALKQTGIGRAVLEYFREVVGFPIFVSPNDNVEREDGSHLTEDAPSFVSHMIAVGLIDGYENERFNHNDDINGFF